jgi:aryl-alcohol dehydrogenase-like predicted oxidoreductase
MERDIIPMCLDEGMAVMPWGVLGSGMYTSFYVTISSRTCSDGEA